MIHDIYIYFFFLIVYIISTYDLFVLLINLIAKRLSSDDKIRWIRQGSSSFTSLTSKLRGVLLSKVVIYIAQRDRQETFRKEARIANKIAPFEAKASYFSVDEKKKK